MTVPVITERAVLSSTVLGHRVEDCLVIIGFHGWTPEDFDMVVTHHGLADAYVDDWQHSLSTGITGETVEVWLVKV